MYNTWSFWDHSIVIPIIKPKVYHINSSSPEWTRTSGHCSRDCQKSMFVYGSSHIELIFEISLLCIYVTINLGSSPGILPSEYLRKQTGNGGFFVSLKKHRRKCLPRNCTHSNWIFIANIQTANVTNNNSLFRTFLLLEHTYIPW